MKEWNISALFAAATLAVTVQSAPATTLTVTNLADGGPGSFRAAITAAAADDVIDFAVNGTIVLSSGELTIDKALNILGPGSGLLTISGGGSSRVLRVESAGSVTISGLTISDGFTSADGGGLYVTDTDLLLRDCSFSANHAEGDGGAIFGTWWGHTPLSPFSIQASSVTTNSAGGDGGGVYFFGNLDIIDSVISNNSSFGQGGGIFSRPETSLTIAHSTISGNHSVSSGGGLWCEDNSCTIVDSVISDNESGATLESAPVLLCGGGIAAVGGSLRVERTTVSGNIAITGGAGICSVFEETTIIDSHIVSNTVRVTPATGQTASGGGILSLGPLALSGSAVSANAAGAGAGLELFGEAIINATTISDNLASRIPPWPGAPAGQGGGLRGCAKLCNSTVSGNSADEGGGIATSSNDADCVTLDHSTVSNNNATIGAGISGDSVTVKNSIIANNHGGANCNATLASNGNNIEDASSCGLLDATDLSDTDPLLGPLADNGGPTLTHLPAAGSPAINAVPLDRCPSSDQRGLVRPFGALCDIGSVELSVESGDDSDGDGITDFFDPCTNPTGNQDMRHVRVMLKNINTDTLASNDGLRLRASFSLPPGFNFSAINPLASGTRVIIENSARTPRIAIVVPARARIRRSAGWASRRGGSLWRFTDTRGSVANGIWHMKIVDLGGSTVGVRIRGRSGIYPVVAGDQPLRVTVVLGSQDAAILGQCGEASFGAGACRFNLAATKLRCR